MAFYTDNLRLSNPAAGECNWDNDWYRNQYITDLVAKQLMDKNGVYSGGVLSHTAPGFEVDVEASSVQVGGVDFTTAAQTLTMPSAALGDEIISFIYVDGLGVLKASDTPPGGQFALLGLADSDMDGVVRIGDLRNMASGGGGGGMEWTLSAVDVDAEADKGYLLNLDTADRVVRLPAGVVGDTIGAGVWKGDQVAYHVSVLPDGADKIMGLAEPMVINALNGCVILVYTDAERGWVITGTTPMTA